MQPAAGNERTPNDVLCLKDMNALSLAVISARSSEIAAVLVNPLQCFHLNSSPPSDLVLSSNNRKVGAKPVLAGSVLGFSVLTLLLPAAAAISLRALWWARVATGVCQGPMYACVFHVYGRIPTEQRARAVSAANAGAPLGIALSFFCGPLIESLLGWPAALRVAGLAYTSRHGRHPGEFSSLNPTGQVPVLLVGDEHTRSSVATHGPRAAASGTDLHHLPPAAAKEDGRGAKKEQDRQGAPPEPAVRAASFVWRCARGRRSSAWRAPSWRPKSWLRAV